MKPVILLGKICFAAIFLGAGLQKFFDNTNFDRTVSDATQSLTRTGLPQALASHGVDAKSFYSIVYGTILFLAFLETMGALAIIFGGDLCGSVMHMIFLLLVTPIRHYPIDGNGQVNDAQLSHLMKNLALFGGCLIIFGYAYQEKFPAVDKPVAREARAKTD